MNGKAAVHLPGLNGLRAIAALAVIVSHTTQRLATFGLSPYILGKSADGKPLGLQLADFGVSIFFALSGFLITFLLLKEKEAGSINVRKFYVRRILRIWPLYYLYLAVILMVLWYYHTPLSAVQLSGYIFMAANVSFLLNAVIPLGAHYWSLGVEEQFYLFWPWLAKTSNKWLIRILVIAVAVLIGSKICAQQLSLKIGALPLYNILQVIRFDCMMIGGIGALLYYREETVFLRWTTALPVQLLSWIALGCMAVNHFHVAAVIDNELASCVGLCLIMGQISGKKKVINLDQPIADFLGKVSYGLYVIHPLIIFMCAARFRHMNIPAAVKYPLAYTAVIAITIIMAWLSYSFYEKRFLKMKTRYTVVKSSDTFVAPPADADSSRQQTEWNNSLMQINQP